MSLLEQKTIKKKQMNENVGQIDFNAGYNKSKKYKVEAVPDSAFYARKSEGDLSRLCYLVL